MCTRSNWQTLASLSAVLARAARQLSVIGAPAINVNKLASFGPAAACVHIDREASSASHCHSCCIRLLQLYSPPWAAYRNGRVSNSASQLVLVCASFGVAAAPASAWALVLLATRRYA
jgi:hypothetical protein